MKPAWFIAGKESVQMLRSQRGLLWLIVYSGLLSAFSLLLARWSPPFSAATPTPVSGNAARW
jgi:hypothetical protein